jgi:hypothetical protein
VTHKPASLSLLVDWGYSPHQYLVTTSRMVLNVVPVSWLGQELRLGIGLELGVRG